MKKRIIPMILVVILALAVSAQAAEPRLGKVSPSLSFSGNTANCYVYVSSGDDPIRATMKLWCGSNLIGTWSDSGTGDVVLSASPTVVRGRSYTLEAYGTIDGQSFEIVPITKTCP